MSELYPSLELEKDKLPETLIIPDPLQKEILSSTSQILSNLLERDSQGQFRRKPGAPNVVTILNRSGTLAAAGVIDFFKRNQIGDPKLVILEGIGSERTQDCGDIFIKDDIPSSTQEDLNVFKDNFTKQTQTENHPLNQDLKKLTQAITNIDSSQGVRIGVIDDFAALGQTTRVMMPILIQCAAENSGNNSDINPPSMDDLIQHYIDDEPHTNRNNPRTISPGTVSYHPEEDILTIFHNPDCAHWQCQITQASFPTASPIELGYLNAALKGPEDSQTPRHDIAIQSSIELFGGRFNPLEQNPQVTLAQRYPNFEEYESQLPQKLSSSIAKLTQSSEQDIINSMQFRQ